MARRFEKAKEYTERFKSVLLPCKHCGNTDIRVASDRMMFPKPKDGWSVCCATHACDSTGVYAKVMEAVNRWNEMQKCEAGNNG